MPQLIWGWNQLSQLGSIAEQSRQLFARMKVRRPVGGSRNGLCGRFPILGMVKFEADFDRSGGMFHTPRRWRLREIIRNYHGPVSGTVSILALLGKRWKDALQLLIISAGESSGRGPCRQLSFTSKRKLKQKIRIWTHNKMIGKEYEIESTGTLRTRSPHEGEMVGGGGGGGAVFHLFVFTKPKGAVE